MVQEIKKPLPLLITAGGMELNAWPANGDYFQLEEMQRMVGGDIQVLPLRDGSVLVTNEKGKLIGLPPNHSATAMFRGELILGDFLVGNILHCPDGFIR